MQIGSEIINDMYLCSDAHNITVSFKHSTCRI